MTTRPVPAPQIPISWGELIDRITILEIKSERLAAAAAVANVRNELALLCPVVEAVPAARDALLETKSLLRAVNERLWDVEDSLRQKEAAGDFGPEFIALARSVFRYNDERTALKRRINRALPCGIAEEKSYAAGARSKG